MDNCIFCKIANKEIASNLIYENEFAVAFNDINPKAPTHILVIPKKHFSTVEDIGDSDLLGNLIKTASKIANEQGLQNGYRLVINKGDDGGQTVYHLHIHILGGRQMTWPPG